jgi:hypothetical protein
MVNPNVHSAMCDNARVTMYGTAPVLLTGTLLQVQVSRTWPTGASWYEGDAAQATPSLSSLTTARSARQVQ